MVLTRERRELMREWVVPLHEAIHRPLGLAEQTDPRRYLHIPKNFSDDDADIRIDLPKHLDLSRDVVADRITQKLALEGVTFDWHPEGRKPYVRVKKTRRPSKNLPTVTHRGNVAGIHDALVGLGSELERRTALDGDLDGVPRLMVVIDRADDTLRHLARYWETFRQEDDPKRSPAIAALETVLYEGRAARVHVIYDGPTTTGSRLIPGAREQFATVILARVSAGTWQRLAPIVDPAPKSSAHRPRPRRPGRRRPPGSGAADDRR